MSRYPSHPSSENIKEVVYSYTMKIKTFDLYTQVGKKLEVELKIKLTP